MSPKLEGEYEVREGTRSIKCNRFSRLVPLSPHDVVHTAAGLRWFLPADRKETLVLSPCWFGLPCVHFPEFVASVSFVLSRIPFLLSGGVVLLLSHCPVRGILFAVCFKATVESIFPVSFLWGAFKGEEEFVTASKYLDVLRF